MSSKCNGPRPASIEDLARRAASHYGFHRVHAQPIFLAILDGVLIEQERCYQAVSNFLADKLPPAVLNQLEAVLDGAEPEAAGAAGVKGEQL